MKKKYNFLITLFLFFIFFGFGNKALSQACQTDADCPSSSYECKSTGYSAQCVLKTISNPDNPETNINTCKWRHITSESPKICPGEKRMSDNLCPKDKPSANLYSSVVCCCPEDFINDTTTKTPDLNPLGNLQIKIPGLDKLAEKHPAECKTDANGETKCTIPWIAVYIKAIYNYFLLIGGLVAVIALMAGGVIWLVSAGNTSRISEAKSWVTGSITGIVILLSSYILLYQINPNLINFRPLEIDSIEPIELPEGNIEIDKKGTTMRKSTKYIIIHTAAGLATRDEVDKFHSSKGWNGIGYNMYIERNGMMVTGRGEDVVGAHSIKYNSESIGISYSGCYEKSQWSNKTTADAIKNKTITQEQFNTLITQIKYYQTKYQIPRANVLGHYEEPVSKACPCLPMNEIRSLINP